MGLSRKAAIAKAKQCVSATEAESLYTASESSGKQAREILYARWQELLKLEAKFGEKSCQTATEAHILRSRARFGTPEWQFYDRRFQELSLTEARAKAMACTTAEEAEELYSGSGAVGMEARSLYRDRWRELEYQEALSKVATCTDESEIRILMHKASDGSPAEQVYWDHLRALQKSQNA